MNAPLTHRTRTLQTLAGLVVFGVACTRRQLQRLLDEEGIAAKG